MGPQALRLKLSWRGLSPDFVVRRGAPDQVDDADLQKIEGRLRDVLQTYPAFAGRPFELPDQLKIFYKLAQDRLVAGPRSSREAGSFGFYAASWLPTDGLHLADEAEGDSAPWIEIGSQGEDTWVFICCDPEDTLFGAVLSCTDCTPWSRTVYENETFPDLAAFLQFLAG